MPKAKRVKSKAQLLPVADWDQADKLIEEIGMDRRAIANAEAEADDKIAAAKAELASTCQPYHDHIDLAIRSLEAFAVHHREAFGDRKSKPLNFGILGWQFSTKISVGKNTAELIRCVFRGKQALPYLHIKETPNREALAKLTDEQLASVAARRVPKDAFYVFAYGVESVDTGGAQ